jgi:biotin carboxylase
LDETVDIADSIGESVILKAYAGGGGIGIENSV